MTGRGLVSVQPVSAEQGGGYKIGCDCGTVTQLIVKVAAGITEAQELAFTCDGCQSVHWFTISPYPMAVR